MTGIPYLNGEGLKGETWSPLTGCSGRGCKVRDYCWAKDMVRRFPAIHNTKKMIYGHMTGPIDIETINHPFNQVQFHPDRLDKPLHWKKPRRIGVCFTGDLFDEQVGIIWQIQVYKVIRQCPQHQFFILTKQPRNMTKILVGGEPLPNVWHGVSITDQEDADTKIPDLLRIPGKHWISYEPFLGPVDFRPYLSLGWICEFCFKRIYVNFLPTDWDLVWQSAVCPECQEKVRNDGGYGIVKGGAYATSKDPRPWKSPIGLIVAGCESGPKRRPCSIEDMINTVSQCKSAGVKCYVKQVNLNGKVERDINKFPTELRVRQI